MIAEQSGDHPLSSTDINKENKKASDALKSAETDHKTLTTAIVFGQMLSFSLIYSTNIFPLYDDISNFFSAQKELDQKLIGIIFSAPLLYETTQESYKYSNKETYNLSKTYILILDYSFLFHRVEAVAEHIAHLYEQHHKGEKRISNFPDSKLMGTINELNSLLCELDKQKELLEAEDANTKNLKLPGSENISEALKQAKTGLLDIVLGHFSPDMQAEEHKKFEEDTRKKAEEQHKADEEKRQKERLKENNERLDELHSGIDKLERTALKVEMPELEKTSKTFNGSIDPSVAKLIWEDTLEGQVDLTSREITQLEKKLRLLKEAETEKKKAKDQEPTLPPPNLNSNIRPNPRTTGGFSLDPLPSPIPSDLKTAALKSVVRNYSTVTNKKKYTKKYRLNKKPSTTSFWKRLARRSKSRDDMVQFVHDVAESAKDSADKDALIFAALLVVKKSIEAEKPKYTSVLWCITKELTENQAINRTNSKRLLSNFWKENQKQYKKWDAGKAIQQSQPITRGPDIF